MLFLAFIMVVLTALFYVASALQYRGHGWADQTCAGAQVLCNSPHYVAFAAIAVIAILFVFRSTKSS